MAIVVTPAPSMLPPVQLNVPVTFRLPSPVRKPEANSKMPSTNCVTLVGTTIVAPLRRVVPPPLNRVLAFQVCVPPPNIRIAPGAFVNRPELAALFSRNSVPVCTSTTPPLLNAP